MKVKALLELTQTLGSLQVNRYINTVFDLPEDEAVSAQAAGLVDIVPGQASLPSNAHNRKTKVVKNMETK